MTEVPRKNRTRSTNALAIAGGFHRRLACLLLGALVGVGCNWQPPPAQSPAEATAVVPVARAEVPVTESHIEMATPKHVQALEEPPVASEPVVPWPNDDLRERIVLLAPGGPIILDTWLTIAGRPHRDRFDEIVATALAAGDTNGDGRRTWTEWRDNTDFFAQSVPNQSPTSQQLDMWVETYDQNRDHRIQQSEIAAWLGRDAGRSAAPLSLRSQRSRDVGGNVESRLWALLDVDESGGLSDAEMAMAPDALWMLDADDDRILLDMELAPLEEQLAGNQARGVQRSRVAQRHAALHFGPQFDVGRLGYLLADMYAPRGTISRESFPGIPSLFEEIDDGDQWLGDDEFARLASIAPHLRLAIAFGDTPNAVPKITRVEISPRGAPLYLAAQPSVSRMVFRLEDCRLVLSVHDLAGAEGPSEDVRRSQTQVMVHDECDELFAYVDANDDGRLGEREVRTVGQRLKACDSNGDGLLSADELPYTMIVALQRGESAAARDFYVPDSAVAPAAASGAPAWFVAADFNEDGDLGRREFLGPPHAFEALDANRDGFVNAREAAEAGQH